MFKVSSTFVEKVKERIFTRLKQEILTEYKKQVFKITINYPMAGLLLGSILSLLMKSMTPLSICFIVFTVGGVLLIALKTMMLEILKSEKIEEFKNYFMFNGVTINFDERLLPGEIKELLLSKLNKEQMEYILSCMNYDSNLYFSQLKNIEKLEKESSNEKEKQILELLKTNKRKNNNFQKLLEISQLNISSQENIASIKNILEKEEKELNNKQNVNEMEYNDNIRRLL